MGSKSVMAMTAKAGRPLRHAANFPSPATHVSLTLMSAIASGLTENANIHARQIGSHPENPG
jgi:hypothetical protein